MKFSGKNTGFGGHSCLQGIFPTQGQNPGSSELQADSLLSESPGCPFYAMLFVKILTCDLCEKEWYFSSPLHAHFLGISLGTGHSFPLRDKVLPKHILTCCGLAWFFVVGVVVGFSFVCFLLFSTAITLCSSSFFFLLSQLILCGFSFIQSTKSYLEIPDEQEKTLNL